MSLDLYITLLGGDGLASKDANGLSDPYAKIELRNAQGVLIEGMRKETKVVRRTLNPTWNERVLFPNVPLDGCIVVECWDWDRIGGHDFMGTSRVTVRELIGNRERGLWVLALEARPGQRDDVCGTLRVKVQCVDSSGVHGSMGLALRQSYHAVQPEPGVTRAPLSDKQSACFPALHRAAYLGDAASLAALLAAAAPDAALCAAAPLAGWAPVHYAAYGGHADVLAQLLAPARAPVPALLHVAAQGRSAGCVACVRLLLDRGSAVVDVSELLAPLQLTALHCVCTLYVPARYHAFRALIEAGLDMNQPDALGRTPLQRLVESGAEEPVQYVLGLGTRLDVTPGVEAALRQLAAARPVEASALQNALRKAGKK